MEVFYHIVFVVGCIFLAPIVVMGVFHVDPIYLGFWKTWFNILQVLLCICAVIGLIVLFVYSAKQVLN